MCRIFIPQVLSYPNHSNTLSDERFINHRGYDRCWYPIETINKNRRKVLTKLFDGFCFVPVGDTSHDALFSVISVHGP